MTAMPVFTIKAKDALAPDAIRAYRDLCHHYGLTAQAAQVELALNEIETWQQAHSDAVNLPDHEHVPAGPRVWTMPEIPNSVRTVRDRHGSQWDAHHQAAPFADHRDRQLWVNHDQPKSWPTAMLMDERGPLTEVTDGD